MSSFHIPWKEGYDKLRQHIKKQRYHITNKGPYSQSYGFSSSHVWMWELDHKKGWALKDWCFWNVVLGKTLESSLDCKEIKPVKPKWNQPWIFIGRTDTEAPILWPPDVKSQLIGKDPDAGKDWKQEEKGMTEDEMVGWHHLTQLTWIWASSRRCRRTGKPGMLQSMGLQRVGHDWANEQQPPHRVILRNKLGKIVRTVLNKCKKIVRKGLIDEVELSEVGRQ